MVKFRIQKCYLSPYTGIWLSFYFGTTPPSGVGYRRSVLKGKPKAQILHKKRRARFNPECVLFDVGGYSQEEYLSKRLLNNVT